MKIKIKGTAATGEQQQQVCQVTQEPPSAGADWMQQQAGGWPGEGGRGSSLVGAATWGTWKTNKKKLHI